MHLVGRGAPSLFDPDSQALSAGDEGPLLRFSVSIHLNSFLAMDLAPRNALYYVVQLYIIGGHHALLSELAVSASRDSLLLVDVQQEARMQYVQG